MGWAEHKAEQDATFPLMKPLLEGNVPIQHFHDADMIVVGDAERCLEKMKHYADLGVDQLICYVQFGHLPHESIMKTLELLGKEIIPKLEKLDIETTASVKANGVLDPSKMTGPID